MLADECLFLFLFSFFCHFLVFLSMNMHKQFFETNVFNFLGGSDFFLSMNMHDKFF